MARADGRSMSAFSCQGIGNSLQEAAVKRILLLSIFILSSIYLNCDKKSSTGPGSINSVTDIDGNVYQTVTIGNQTWMAENLKVTHYRNGDAIFYMTNRTSWGNLTTGAYCYYNYSPTHAATYGLLYNWYAVIDSRDIAPEGWHVPTDEDWKELEMFLGMSQSEADESGDRGTDEGGQLKETGTSHWSTPNMGATNESGFTALPGGYISIDNFYELGDYGYFWSSSEGGSNSAWFRVLSYISSVINRSDYDRGDGFSVRCVKD